MDRFESVFHHRKNCNRLTRLPSLSLLPSSSSPSLSSSIRSTKLSSLSMMISLFVSLCLLLTTRTVQGFSLSMTAESFTSTSSTTKHRKGTTVIAGATGYIGKSTVRESIRQGYHTVALVRDLKKVQSVEGKRLYGRFFEGGDIVECDVSDPIQLAETLEKVKQRTGGVDAVVSCLASRSGIKKEAYAVDYQATLNCLDGGIECGARHFVLLSAICVRKPLLQFQHAKLKFEGALQAQSSMTYSIVRPTAFFKSVSGQLERLQEGKPFLMFQDSTRCNPIAESDLAKFIIDCITEPSRRNQIINLGGPDRPLTKIEQGEMLFRAIGKEPKYSRLPIWIFDVSIDVLQWLADLFKSEQLENAAELGRIGKYYAVEDMVEHDNRYGTITLQEYFNRIATGGQEYDPYTSMTGILGLLRNDDSNKPSESSPGMNGYSPTLSLALSKNDTLVIESSAAEGVY